ncbi:MAG: murein biosynthesis integral membrane protein MurJ [Thermoanaerobaculia bacterium]
MTADRAERRKRLGGATRIAAGILSSRVLGLVREAVVAFFFGVGAHADVFRSAFRAPNLIQNLLGEQTLSAAFIPVYSRLLGEGRARDAGRFAGAVFGLLLASASAVALLGVFLARPLVAVFTPGYLGDGELLAAGAAAVDRFELAVVGVRILFPMTAFLALAAWTLGVLNSHRRFFLPYFAPVLWNAAIIGGLLLAGWEFLTAQSDSPVVPEQNRILVAAFVGGLVGGILQFAVQLPSAVQSLTGFRPSLSLAVEGVREALTNVVPVLAARGAAQVSSYLDVLLASLLAAGAVGAMGNAMVLYLLPISLFALSVAAAELPELSRRSELAECGAEARVVHALRRISFFVVPTQVGYLAFGFLIVGALYRRGQFGAADNWLVYLVLAAYSLGLVATSWSRLLINVFYARGETRKPARISIGRMLVSMTIGVALMFWLDRFGVGDLVAGIGGDHENLMLGAVGLAIGSAAGAWFEWLRLRFEVRRLGVELAWPTSPTSAAYGRALAALALGAALWFWTRKAPHLIAGGVVVFGYAGAYLALSKLQGVPEVEDVLRVLRRGDRGG